MSILLQATETTPVQWAILTLLMVVALAGAWGIGVFRGRSLDAARMDAHRRFPPLAITFLVGFSVFFLAQVGCGMYLSFARARPPGQRFDLAQLTAMEWALLAVVPEVLMLLAIIAMRALVYGGTLGRLGAGVSRLGPGFLGALVAMLITLPLIFWFSAITEAVYERLEYQHPMEHDLLRVLPQSGGWARALMLLAISVVAPVAEETLFRGHLQTALRRLFAGRIRSASGGGFDVVVTEAPNPADAPSAPPPLPLPPPSPAVDAGGEAVPVVPAIPDAGAGALVPAPAPPWTAWAAIVLTSVVFAAIHPLWSAPPIFLLSVALGYAYERTNNLWTCVFMHSLFNSTSTLLFWLTSR